MHHLKMKNCCMIHVIKLYESKTGVNPFKPPNTNTIPTPKKKKKKKLILKEKCPLPRKAQSLAIPSLSKIQSEFKTLVFIETQDQHIHTDGVTDTKRTKFQISNSALRWITAAHRNSKLTNQSEIHTCKGTKLHPKKIIETLTDNFTKPSKFII